VGGSKRYPSGCINPGTQAKRNQPANSPQIATCNGPSCAKFEASGSPVTSMLGNAASAPSNLFGVEAGLRRQRSWLGIPFPGLVRMVANQTAIRLGSALLTRDFHWYSNVPIGCSGVHNMCNSSWLPNLLCMIGKLHDASLSLKPTG
jgi:hypothetical protein